MTKKNDNKDFKDREFLRIPIPNDNSQIEKLKKILSSPPIPNKRDQLSFDLELPEKIENDKNRIKKHDERMNNIRKILNKK